MSQYDRLAPQNREAEEAVLGSLLIDPDVILDVEFLTPKMFYWQVNQWVCEAIINLSKRGEPVDSLTLINELQKTRNIEDVESYVIGLVTAVPTSIHARAYAKIVEAAYIRRTIIYLAGNMAKMAYDEQKDITELIGDVQSGARGVVDALHHSESTASTFEEVVKLTIDHMEKVYDGKAKPGMKIGIPKIDTVLQGVLRGSLFILAARPGQGKSSLVSHVVGANKFSFGRMYSLEMSKIQVGQRFISQEKRLDLSEVRQPNDKTLETSYNYFGDLAGAKFTIDDNVKFSDVEKLCQDAERYYIQNDGNLDFIIVDHIGLMSSARFRGKENRTAEMSHISLELKRLAMRLNCVVIALSQLNRNVENRADKRPILADLRDSGSLEQDASQVLFIYRDDYYHPDTSDRPGVAEIIIAKNRDAPTATVDLFWHGSTVSFLESDKVGKWGTNAG